MPTSLPEYGRCPTCERVQKLKGRAGNRTMKTHLWRPKAGAKQEQCPGTDKEPKPGSSWSPEG